MARTRGIRVGRAFVELFADDSKLVRGLRRAQRRLKAIGASVRAIGLKLLGLGAAIGAPFAAGIKAAKDAQETLNKFEQVFGRQAKAAGEFAGVIAREIGRSRYEVRDQMAGLQAFFQGLKFEPGQAFEMAKQVERFALDFASLYNLADADALVFTKGAPSAGAPADVVRPGEKAISIRYNPTIPLDGSCRGRRATSRPSHDTRERGWRTKSWSSM